MAGIEIRSFLFFDRNVSSVQMSYGAEFTPWVSFPSLVFEDCVYVGCVWFPAVCVMCVWFSKNGTFSGWRCDRGVFVCVL